MLLNNDTIIKKGDWVKGSTPDGELIIGYIESLNSLAGAVNVTVVKSDKKETIGKTIEVGSKRVKSLPISMVRNKEQILFLIDLALLTGDQDWFTELSSQLNAMRQLVSDVI
jgi:hypothetical protein